MEGRNYTQFLVESKVGDIDGLEERIKFLEDFILGIAEELGMDITFAGFEGIEWSQHDFKAAIDKIRCQGEGKK